MRHKRIVTGKIADYLKNGSTRKGGELYADELPPTSVSWAPMSLLKTSLWRNFRPVYVKRRAPCVAECPAGNDVEGFLRLAAQEKHREAKALIFKTSPFPGLCGRVCHHPCEKVCNRSEFDDAVKIHAVERFLGDVELLHRTKGDSNFKVAVIGSGPSGLSCAYHLAGLGVKVTVYEAESEPGGIPRTGIPGYRLPRDILNKEISIIEKSGVAIKTGVRIGRNKEFQELKNNYDAVYIASGAHKSMMPGIEGENLGGVYPGLSILKKIINGEHVELGKRIGVIGGGNTAMDVARAVLRLGAEPRIFYRRTRMEMPAIPEEIEHAEKEGIPIEFLLSPVRVIGECDRVQGVEFVRMKLGEPDQSGRRRPVQIPGSEYIENLDTLLLAIGEESDVDFLPDDLELDRKMIKIDSNGMTSIKGVFAGGDATDQPRTVSHAIGSGRKAASQIYYFLTGMQEKEQADAGEQERDVVKFSELNLFYYEKKPCIRIKELALLMTSKNFDEIIKTYTQAEAEDEASRCFHCGNCNECWNCFVFCPDSSVRKDAEGNGFLIDYDHCKGCGICVAECPRAAMRLEREEA